MLLNLCCDCTYCLDKVMLTRTCLGIATSMVCILWIKYFLFYNTVEVTSHLARV